MAKRFAVAIVGMLLGGAAGWMIASYTGWTFVSTIGIIAGGVGAVIWAESRRVVPTIGELKRPRPISLTDRDEKP